MQAFWIILTGSLVAVTCGLLGCYLMLRKMSMVGDAISHSVLPGIVIAYLVTGSNSSIPMLAGAAAIGVFASFLIETFHKSGKLQTDASIGLTFTWLFAVGVILISLFARNVHIDTDCVLYGEIAYVPLDTIVTGSGLHLGPRTVWILGGALLFILLVITIGYKGLFITTFDPAYAASLGISTAFWHYTLMGMVSLASVVSFESVGAILVVAMLIVPAAIAYLLTDNFPTMLLLSALAGILASAAGYFLAVWIDGSIAGAITVALGAEFLLAFLFSPLDGMMWRKERV
ncbi:MAG TPA: metal ABC transporter permease [Chitinophagales bacterium]|nr:metal ABC transporter permease [Chitinophagales bacterium]